MFLKSCIVVALCGLFVQVAHAQPDAGVVVVAQPDAGVAVAVQPDAGVPVAQPDAGVPVAGPTTNANPATPEPPSSQGVADAPRPGAARNLRQDERSHLRHLIWAPRVLLFPFKTALWAAMAPVRGALWLYDTHGVGARLARLFSGNGPVSVFPTARLEPGFGATYGVGASVTDAFGEGERLTAAFLFGGEVRQIYGGKLRSGRLFGERVSADAELELQLLKNSSFFGLGSASLQPVPAMAIDALTDDAAVVSRFDQTFLRVESGVELQVTPVVHMRLSGAVLHRTFGGASDDDAVQLTMAYQADSLTGLQSGFTNAYSELSVIYDTRQQSQLYVSRAVPNTGWKAEMFAGYSVGVGELESRYARLGADVQRYIDLYRGDRVLILRGQVEGVVGALDQIPFVDMPRLGGSRVLRGYVRGRFRDRLLGLATAEYRYPINSSFAGFAFVDAGSVWRSVSAVDAGDIKFGYGAGILMHSYKRFLMRVQVAGGEDGVVFNLSFNPAERIKRRSHRR